MLDIITPRRLVTTAVLVLVVVLCIYGLQKVDTSDNASCGGGANSASPIKVLYPCPGADEPRQGRIGVSLADGYTATLSIDGLTIPTLNMTIEGPTVFYTPAQGKVLPSLSPGTHVAVIDYYPLSADPSTGTTYRWQFTAH